MKHNVQKSYELILNYENQFAHRVAKQIIQKPRISAWLVLMPILFLFYAQKIQQYKTDIHNFCKGLIRTKQLALDSALKEIDTGKKDEIENHFESSEITKDIIQVRIQQLAEIKLLKGHYDKLLRHQGSSYMDLIRQTYQTAGNYRLFLNHLTQIEKSVMDAVLHAYHPNAQHKDIAQKIYEVVMALREDELKLFFG